jgi:hypothetical protein
LDISGMCFGYLVRQNLWTEFPFFSKFWPKNIYFKKKTFEYLENDPLSVLKPIVTIIDG